MTKQTRSAPIKTNAQIKKEVPGGSAMHHLAFENSLQPNIITIAKTGKIIYANKAAARLLGYSVKALMTLNRASVFLAKDMSFRKMLKDRSNDGHSGAEVRMITKKGVVFPCEITSALFVGEHGIEKAIFSLADMRVRLKKQKDIDSLKSKEVAHEADTIRKKQVKIDIMKDFLTARNIDIAESKFNARLAENNSWIKYIAKTSYDVMWDWDVATGQIYVGDSLQEVFGHSIENNQTNLEFVANHLLPASLPTIKLKLKSALDSKKPSWNDHFQLIRSDKTIADTSIRASIIRNEKGKATRLIGAIQDISRVKELENKLADETNTGNLSFYVIWDWDILAGNVNVSEQFEELFGDAETGHTIAYPTWMNMIDPLHRKRVSKSLKQAMIGDKQWEQWYRLIRSDGTTAEVFAKGNFIRDKDNNPIRLLGTLQDVNRQKLLASKWLEEHNKMHLQDDYEKYLQIAFNLSTDVLFDCNLVTNEFIISKGYEKEFGYPAITKMTPAADWEIHVVPEDRQAVATSIQDALKSSDTEWDCTFRFVKADDTIVQVRNYGIILRNENGKAFRIIGYMEDLSKKKTVADNLVYQIQENEQKIIDAEQNAKEAERTTLGMELHDNVNQLLAASKLFLDMAKRGGDNTEMYLQRSSEYTVTAMDEIRNLSRGLVTDTIRHLGLCEAITLLARDIMQVNKMKILFNHTSFDEANISEKMRLNIYRIVQEHLSNIIKHAAASKVSIKLSKKDKTLDLTITDDGIGFNTSTSYTGIGLENIKNRAVALNGNASFFSTPGKGCKLAVNFLMN